MLPPGEETVNAQLGTGALESAGIAPNRAIKEAFPPYGKTSLRSASRASISARLSSSSPASAASITDNSSAASVRRVTVT